MNGCERILAALRGEPSDTVPVMLHNFMMAMREAGYTHAQFRADPDTIADAFIRAVETYDYDGILVDIDTATLAGAVGVPVTLPDDESARCRAGGLLRLEAVADLPPPDVGADPRIRIWLDAVRRLKAHFGDAVCIRGNCDQAPFSLASMMRTPEAWMLDLMDEDNRENVFRLLDFCTEATCQFVRLMAETGAHVTSNGDSPAGPDMISPAMYETFALPYEKRVVAQAHASGLPYVLHICGDTTPILKQMASTGTDAVELDYKTDAKQARAVLDNRICFIGNLDPSGVLARGSVAEVERKTRELLTVFRDTPRFILNAGCAMPPDTPPENVRAMIRTARCFG
ncbi:MAG: uroporphyrinogen decarboxylase family protein [Lentisphaerae bacterium]|nr:uroporphyrinogen decarboxylase family protein [Lentisphaerota bacterium]